MRWNKNWFAERAEGQVSVSTPRSRPPATRARPHLPPSRPARPPCGRAGCHSQPPLAHPRPGPPNPEGLGNPSQKRKRRGVARKARVVCKKNIWKLIHCSHRGGPPSPEFSPSGALCSARTGRPRAPQARAQGFL